MQSATDSAGRRFPKVFGIGAGKTGSSTLAQVFKRLGLALAPQAEAEHALIAPTLRGDLQPLRAYVERFEAFQDFPFSHGLTFAQLDALFPGSKFILTIRDPDEWFDSVERFTGVIARSVGLERITREALEAFDRPYRGAYAEIMLAATLTQFSPKGGMRDRWDRLHDRKLHIREFNRRNSAIQRHFRFRPDDLLVIDVTREPDVSRIIAFLGLQGQEAFEMPHAFSTAAVGQALAKG